MRVCACACARVLARLFLFLCLCVCVCVESSLREGGRGDGKRTGRQHRDKGLPLHHNHDIITTTTTRNMCAKPSLNAGMRVPSAVLHCVARAFETADPDYGPAFNSG
jgi:hypothetical protein